MSSRKTMPLPRRPLPPMARIRQNLASDRIADVRRDVREKLASFGIGDKVKPGGRIAITAGSRGIGGFVELLLGITDAVRAAGGEPFIIPAMGSHGGATPEGQTEVLRRLGVDDRSAGAPVRATMETRELGAAENGAVAHVDRLAFEADGIIVLGRTKTHPESFGELASGLLKMCTIGLGKQTGAHQAHSHELWDSVRAVPESAAREIQDPLRRRRGGERIPPALRHRGGPAGLRSLSGIRHAPAQGGEGAFRAHPVRGTGRADRGRARQDHLGRRHGSERDWKVESLPGEPRKPNYRRIAALSLTHPSLGNGLGIGMADFTTRRFADAYDPAVSYVNLLTASEPGNTTREGPMPLALDSDREAAEVALFSSLAGASPRVCRIGNTGLLDEFWASEALLSEIGSNPKLEVLEKPAALPFDSSGNLF